VSKRFHTAFFNRWWQRIMPFRKSLPVFVSFLFLSIILWLIIRLSTEYEETLAIPLSFQTNVDDYSLVYYSDTVIYAKAKLKGTQLATWQFRRNAINFPLHFNNLRLKTNRQGYAEVFIPTAQLSSDLTTWLHSSTSVVVVSPDTLYFAFEKTQKKRVSVKPLLKYKLDSRYLLVDSIRVVPDSVVISGPSRIIDTITFINTQKLDAGEISTEKNFSLKLQNPFPHSGIRISHDKVNIQLKVEPSTEATLMVPIRIPDTSSCAMKLFPDQVTLRLLVPYSLYRNLSAKDFSVSVPCPDSSNFKHKMLQVKIDHLPAGTKLVEVEPEEVEFLIYN